jgi:hypothetical protein
MYDEKCKHCGAKEAAHDIRHDFDLRLDYNLTGVERDSEIAKRFVGEGVPCEVFESEVDHLPGCSIVIDYSHINGRTVEVYCQDLPGKCSQLLAIHQGLAELPE